MSAAKDDFFDDVDFGQDAPPSEQAYVEAATGEAPAPEAMPQAPSRAPVDVDEDDGFFADVDFGEAPAQPAYQPQAQPPIEPELAPAVIEPTEDAPWHEDMYHFFTGGTGIDKEVKHTRTTEAIPVTTAARDRAVVYAEKLAEIYTAETPGTIAAGAEYAGEAISEFFGAAREQGQIAIRDPYRTPITPQEESMSWGTELDQRMADMPMTPERVLSAIDTLEEKIALEASYLANKQGFWHGVAHPMAKSDRNLAERRIGQLQGLVDVLETTRYRPENTIEHDNPIAFDMAMSVGAEEGVGRRVSLYQDADGAIRANIAEYTDPLAGKSTGEQALMMGIDDIIENTYTGAAQTLAAFPVLAKMAVVDAPAWIYGNTVNEFARWEIEDAGDRLTADKNIEIMQDIMRGMSVEPGSHEEMVEWGKLPEESLEAHFRLNQQRFNAGQLAAYIEARDKLDTVQSKYLRSLDEGTTWDAPVQGAEAMWESITSEVDDYGVGGYFLQNPIDLLGLVSVAGTAARLPASLLAKTAPMTRTISGTVAASASAPSKQLGRQITGALSPEARALLPAGEQLVGGRAFRALKEGLTKTDDGVAISAAQEAQAMNSLRAAHVMRTAGSVLENADPIMFALSAPLMAARRITPAQHRHFFAKEGARHQPIQWGDEATTIDAVITKNQSEFDLQLADIKRWASDMPGDEQTLEAVHRTLRTVAQRDGVDPQFMFVMREGPSSQPEPVSLTDAEQADWGKANFEIDPEVESFKNIRDHANERIAAVLDELDDGNVTLDSRWTQVVDRGNAHDVWVYMQRRLEGHPAMLEQLGEKADDLVSMQNKLRSEKMKPEIAKLKSAIKKHDKELRQWSEKTLKKLEDPNSTILSGLADHLNTLGKAEEVMPTKGLPSLATMAYHLQQGKQLRWIPAHHIALAKTMKQLRSIRQTDPEAFAKIRINHGEHRFTGEQMIRRFDNFDAANNYLDLLDQEFNVATLDNLDVVYSERLPLGIDKVDIGQMNDTARHTMAARKLLLHGGMESVRVGNLAESTFWRNVENYAPDFYRQYLTEFNKAGIDDPSKLVESLAFMVQNGYNGSHYQHAFNKAMFNVTEREMVGLVKDPRFYVAKGLHTIISDIQFKKFTNGLVNAVTEEGIPLVFNPAKHGGEAPVGYIRAGRRGKRVGKYLGKKKPYAERWLDLEGMYIHPEVHHYLQATRNLDEGGILLWFNRNVMNRWKFGKTVLNPPGQIRNVYTNTIMATMAGLNPFTSKSAREAWKGTLKQYYHRDSAKGSIIEKAMQGQLFGKDFISAELKRDLYEIWEEGGKVRPDADLRNLPEPQNMPEFAATLWQKTTVRIEDGLKRVYRKSKAGYRAGADKAAWAYTAGDEVFKLWRFKQVLELQNEFRRTGKITRDMRRTLGKDNKFLMEVLDHPDGVMAYRAAAKESHRWFFDYTDVPGWVNFTRKTSMPFFTYSYKAIPRVAKWLNENPVQSFMWRQAFDYMNFTNEFMYGEHDWEDIYEAQVGKEQVPGWARATSVTLPTGAAREFDIEKQRYGKRGIRRRIKRGVEMAPYWDVQYWTQIGGLYSAPEPERGVQGWERVANATIQHPLWTSIWSLANRPEWDKYGSQGGRIWKDEDSSFVALNKLGKQLWRTWAPPYTPGLPTEGRDDHGRKIDYAKLGAGLLAGGGSMQKLMAAAMGTPDYRVERGISKLREYDETIGEMLGYRLNWRDDDPRKLRKDLRVIKKRIRRDRDTELRGVERGDREARRDIIQKYDEQYEQVEDYYKQVNRTISSKALRFTRAIKKATEE